MTKLRSLLPSDQLNLDAAAFDGFDPEQDMDRIAEVEEESRNVRSSKQRIVLFLVTMRHFALDPEKRRRHPALHPTRCHSQRRHPARAIGGRYRLTKT